MNLFAQQIKFEDTEGLDYPEGQLITEGDEGESVAAAVAEVTEEEAGVAEDERAMDGLVEDEETLSEVQDVVENDAPKMEHTGLTPVGARLAKLVLARVVGKRHADKTLPKMEHFNSRSDARDATSFVQEGVSDALKSFWEALKAQFKKMWAKIKTWYIKTFSAAKALAERAKTIRNRAETMSSTIDKRAFPFGQVKTLSMEGNMKQPDRLIEGLKNVASIIEGVVELKTEDAISDIADNVDTVYSQFVGTSNASGNNTPPNLRDKLRIAGELATSRFEVLDPSNNKLVDDKAAMSALGAGEGSNTNVATSELLPGDKLLAEVVAVDSEDLLKALRTRRFSFVNSKHKPKEVSSDAEAATLSTSQIANICNIIADSADSIFDFEKAWQRADKQQENFLRKIDEIARDIKDEDKEKDASDKDSRKTRELISTTTDFVQRMGKLPAMVISFAQPVYAASLNYCEASMRNYKK